MTHTNSDPKVAKTLIIYTLLTSATLLRSVNGQHVFLESGLDLLVVHAPHRAREETASAVAHDHLWFISANVYPRAAEVFKSCRLQWREFECCKEDSTHQQGRSPRCCPETWLWGQTLCHTPTDCSLHAPRLLGDGATPALHSTLDHDRAA